MPIYEYRCSTCGKTFEKIQRFSDAPVEVHEECGGKVEKLISTSALMFKGSGFYITDYAKSGSKAESSPKSESKADGKGDTKSDGKSDSKNEGASESKSGGSESKTESKAESKPAAPAAKSE
jgi:putative FmdB family regulatory protein